VGAQLCQPGLRLLDRLMQRIRGSAEARLDRGTGWIPNFPLRRLEGSGRPAAGQRAAPR